MKATLNDVCIPDLRCLWWRVYHVDNKIRDIKFCSAKNTWNDSFAIFEVYSRLRFLKFGPNLFPETLGHRFEIIVDSSELIRGEIIDIEPIVAPGIDFGLNHL